MIRSEQTRKFIIEKTASIFNKKGYTGTYLSDLTNATGLTKGSIYGNFKDKNEVAVEAFRYNYALFTNEVSARIEQEKNSVEKLLVFLNYYKRDYANLCKNGGCPILNTAIDSDDGNKFLKQEVTRAINNWIKTLIAILNDGIQKKELKKINATNFSHRMIALIEGSIMLSKTLNEPNILIANIEALEQEVKQLTKK